MSGFSSADLIRAAVVLTLLVPALAHAQSGQPLRLGPAGSGATLPPAVTPSPPSLTPRSLAPPTGGTLPTRPPEPPPPGAWGGTLDRIAGGLGREMWAGTPAETAAELLSEIPVRTTSPALRDLVVRLLLSRAEGPAGADAATLDRLRKEKLAAFGIGGPPPPVPATPAGVEEATPAQLAALSGDPAASAAVRVAAAERGARSGSVTAESLLAAYSLLPLEPVAREEPLAAAAVNPDNARAILALGLAGETTATRRLAVADAYLATLPASAAVGPAARIATERLDGLEPAVAGIEAATRIARALYGVGERARPVVWHRAALAGAGDATARRDALRLAPLSLAAAAIDPPGDLGAWIAVERMAGPPEEARIRVAAILAVLEGLGMRVPEFDRRDLYDEGGRAPEPPTAAWAALEGASGTGRVAETVAAAAWILGPDGPETATAVATASAVRGLVAVGLVDEARALAREAILARYDPGP